MSGLGGLESALIGAGGLVAGAFLGIAGNERLERQRERREAKRRSDAAVAELLAAAVDLLSGVQVIQAAYEGRSGWRWRMRTAATVFAALCSAFAGAGEVSLRALLDWRHAGRLIDRLLGEDRRLDEAQRVTALDIGGVVVTRTGRFYAALVTVTAGASDRGLSESASRLAEAVGQLLEVMGGKQRAYHQARARAERALSEFRRAAERRKR
jgi:hypothetical protein